MIAALECKTAICETHAFIGFLIVAGWFVVFAWGGLAWWPLHREPGRFYWGLLGVLQGILILQLVIGLIMWLRTRPDVAAPAVRRGVPGDHPGDRARHGPRHGSEEDRYKIFAVAAFFIFGLTLRALMTGLGVA